MHSNTGYCCHWTSSSTRSNNKIIWDLVQKRSYLISSSSNNEYLSPLFRNITHLKFIIVRPHTAGAHKVAFYHARRCKLMVSLSVTHLQKPTRDRTTIGPQCVTHTPVMYLRPPRADIVSLPRTRQPYLWWVSWRRICGLKHVVTCHERNFTGHMSPNTW